MATNQEMELASAAIQSLKNGMHESLEDACSDHNADMAIAESMIEVVIPEERSLITSRQTVCNSCPNNINSMCMVCACPMDHLLYTTKAICPEGKW
jgi:hypothetical protein